MRRVLVAALVVAATGAPGRSVEGGAETMMDKYQALLQERRSLARENAILQRESAAAATKKPYILLHMDQPRLEFRIRGKGLKTYVFKSLALDERAHRPVDVEAVWKVLDQPLTVVEIEGSRPELIPPDPETGREAGLLFSDPNQLASQTGTAAQPVRTDAGVLGVDVPTDYYIRLVMGPKDHEEAVVVNIRTPKSSSFRQKAIDRLDEIAGNIRSNWSRWWSGKDLDATGKPLVELYLTTDPDTAKYLHYSLLPGEKVFVVPPPPPPIVLIASTEGSASRPDAASVSR